MTPSTSKRVSGHTLRSEGRAFTSEGKLPPYRTYLGHGKCSCGALSPELNSDGQRKAWHREHKAEVTSRVTGERL